MQEIPRVRQTLKWKSLMREFTLLAYDFKEMLNSFTALPEAQEIPLFRCNYTDK